MFEIANTLALNQTYLVLFEKTKQPYITEAGDSIIFLREEDANDFLDSTPGTVLAVPRFYKAETLCNILYGAGAERIKVIMPRREQERHENLKALPKKKYFNHTLNQNLNLLHETKKSEYLKNFKKARFIVPIKISNVPNINIEYSVARIGEKRYFLTFSSLEEFRLWAQQVAGYEPLEISFDELVELCDNDDCIINVSGSRYVLNQDKLKKIMISK